MAAAEKNVVVAYGGVRDFLIKWLQDVRRGREGEGTGRKGGGPVQQRRTG